MTAPPAFNWKYPGDTLTGEGGQYCKSSIADKMSDYEDIWNEPASSNNSFERSMTPAESESQLKTYLASKLGGPTDGLSQTSSVHPSSSISSSSSTISSSKSSYISSTTPSRKSCTSSSMSPGSTLPQELPTLGEIHHQEEGIESQELCLETSSSQSSAALNEPIYSDPLDALENAKDTQIYETLEKKEKESGESSEDSETVFENIQTDHESSEDEDASCQTDSQLELKLSRSLMNLSQHQDTAVVSSPESTMNTSPTKSCSQEDLAVRDQSLAGRKLSDVRRVSRKKSASKATRRLSSVLGKYMNGISSEAASAASSEQAVLETSWQLESSSWEFLGSNPKKAETPVLPKRCAPSPYDNMFNSTNHSRAASRPETPPATVNQRLPMGSCHPAAAGVTLTADSSHSKPAAASDPSSNINPCDEEAVSSQLPLKLSSITATHSIVKVDEPHTLTGCQPNAVTTNISESNVTSTQDEQKVSTEITSITSTELTVPPTTSNKECLPSGTKAAEENLPAIKNLSDGSRLNGEIKSQEISEIQECSNCKSKSQLITDLVSV